MSGVLDRQDHYGTFYCDKCGGRWRHRYDCPSIPESKRREGLEQAVFEGDVRDEEYYPARDTLDRLGL